MSEILEMTVKPTPQWIKDAGQEIAKEYNLRYVEGIFIGGIIAKHYRTGNTQNLE